MTCKAKNIYSLSDPSRKSQQALEPRWQLINGQTLEPRKNNEVWGMEPCTPKWWHRKSGVTGTNVTTHLKQLRTKYKKTPVVQTMDIKQWRTMISGQKTRVNLTTWGIFPGCRAGRGTPSAQKTLGAEWMQLKTGKPRQAVLIGQCSGEHTRRKSCTDKTPEMYRGTPGAVSRVWSVLGGRKLPQAWERTTLQDWRERTKEVRQGHEQCLFWSQTGKTHDSWGTETSTQKSLASLVGENDLQTKSCSVLPNKE